MQHKTQTEAGVVVKIELPPDLQKDARHSIWLSGLQTGAIGTLALLVAFLFFKAKQ